MKVFYLNGEKRADAVNTSKALARFNEHFEMYIGENISDAPNDCGLFIADHLPWTKAPELYEYARSHPMTKILLTRNVDISHTLKKDPIAPNVAALDRGEIEGLDWLVEEWEKLR